MVRCSACALLIFATFTHTAHAAPSLGSDETKAMIIASLSQDNMAEAAKRLELVDAIGAYCQSLERAFPKNSPAENAWLQGEMGGEPDRMMRAVESPEAARRQAEAFVISCTSNARAYSAGGNRPKVLVALALTFNRFQYEAADAARKNNVDVDRYGFRSLRFVTTALLVAALLEPSPSR